MPYYMGDYQSGGYYRGDPGLLGSIGSFLGGAVKTVGRVALGGLTGGIGGVVGTVVGGLLSKSSSPPPSLGPTLSLAGGPNLPAVVPKGPIIRSPGGAVGISPLGTPGMLAPMRGFHMNRSAYWVSPGVRVPKFSKTVRNRHMNVGNARALKRALRRAHGFARLARHVMSFQLTGRHTGRGHFKVGRRARR